MRTIEKEDIVFALELGGIRHGDVVLMHSAMSSIGQVNGGADTVIDAVLEAVGPEGTFAVSTMSFHNPFDAEKDPSTVGIISETHRLRPNSIRSLRPVHRDFLGSLMGAGISRESVGDICVGNGSCDFFVTGEVAPYLLQNLSSAGRTKLHLEAVSLPDARIPEPEVKEIRDTLASLRLDSVISSGFRISRGAAVQLISAGKAAIDGLPCEKADKTVSQGAKISVRGLGKIRLQSVNGQTKKGRISVVIGRYV